jgi:hypothetical protein
MAAITGIHIIEGKPTASSALMSALVRKAGHRLRITGNDERAVVEITRCDDPDYTFRVEWTIARAKQAGLTGKDVWKKYPAALLKARGITECARDACEEALMGMHYTPEELGAAVDEDGIPVQVVSQRAEPAAPAAASPTIDWDAELASRAGNPDALRELYTMARGVEPNNLALAERIAAAGKAAKEAVEAAADAPLEAEVVEDGTAGEMANERQLTAIAAALGEHGVKDREHRLAVISLLIGDRVGSMRDLMHVEATHVLDSIKHLVEAGTFAQTSRSALASLAPAEVA